MAAEDADASRFVSLMALPSHPSSCPKVAARLDAAGRQAEAKKLISEALAAIAAKPEEWDLLLVLLANEYPGAGAPLDAEQSALLRGLVVSAGR